MAKVNLPQDDNSKKKRQQSSSKQKQKNYQQALTYERAFLKKKSELEKSATIKQLKDEISAIQAAAAVELETTRSTMKDKVDQEAALSRIRLQLAADLSKKQLELIAEQRRAEYEAHEFAAECAMRAFQSQDVHQRARTSALLADAQKVQTEKLRSIRAAEIAELEAQHKVATSSGEKRKITLQIHRLQKDIASAEAASAKYQQQASRYAEVVKRVDYERLSAAQKLAVKQQELKDLQAEAVKVSKEIDSKIEAKKIDIEVARSSGNTELAAQLESEIESLRSTLDETERRYRSSIVELTATIEGVNGLKNKSQQERGTRVQTVAPKIDIKATEIGPKPQEVEQEEEPQIVVQVKTPQEKPEEETHSPTPENSEPQEDQEKDHEIAPVEDTSKELSKPVTTNVNVDVSSVETISTDVQSQVTALLEYLANFVTSFENYVDVLESRLNENKSTEFEVVVPQQGAVEVSKDDSKEVISYLRTLIADAASDNIELQTLLTQRLDNLANALDVSDAVVVTVDPVVVTQQNNSASSTDILRAIQEFQNELFRRLDSKTSSSENETGAATPEKTPVTLDLNPSIHQSKLILDCLSGFVTLFQSYFDTVDSKFSEDRSKIQVSISDSSDASGNKQDMLTYLKSLVEQVTSSNTDIQTQLLQQLSELRDVLSTASPVVVEVEPLITRDTDSNLATQDVLQVIQAFRTSLEEKLDSRSTSVSVTLEKQDSEQSGVVLNLDPSVDQEKLILSCLHDFFSTFQSYVSTASVKETSAPPTSVHVSIAPSEDKSTEKEKDLVTYLQDLIQKSVSDKTDIYAQLTSRLDELAVLLSNSEPAVLDLPTVNVETPDGYLSKEDVVGVLQSFMSQLETRLNSGIFVPVVVTNNKSVPENSSSATDDTESLDVLRDFRDKLQDFVSSFQSYLSVVDSLNSEKSEPLSISLALQSNGEDTTNILTYLQSLLSQLRADEASTQAELLQQLDQLIDTVNNSNNVSIDIPEISVDSQNAVTTENILATLQTLKDSLIAQKELVHEDSKPVESTVSQSPDKSVLDLKSQYASILNSVDLLSNVVKTYFESSTVLPPLPEVNVQVNEGDNGNQTIEVTVDQESSEEPSTVQDVFSYLQTVVETLEGSNTQLRSEMLRLLTDVNTMLATVPAIDVTIPDIQVDTGNSGDLSTSVLSAIQQFRQDVASKLVDTSASEVEPPETTNVVTVEPKIDSAVKESQLDSILSCLDVFTTTFQAYVDSIDTSLLVPPTIEVTVDSTSRDASDTQDSLTYLRDLIIQSKTDDAQLKAELLEKLSQVTELSKNVPTHIILPELNVNDTAPASLDRISSLLTTFLAELNTKISSESAPEINIVNSVDAPELTVSVPASETAPAIERLVSAFEQYLTSVPTITDNVSSKDNALIVSYLRLLVNATQHDSSLQSQLIQRISSLEQQVFGSARELERPLEQDTEQKQAQMYSVGDFSRSIQDLEKLLSSRLGDTPKTEDEDEDSDPLKQLEKALADASKELDDKKSVTAKQRAGFMIEHDKLAIRDKKYEGEVRREYQKAHRKALIKDPEVRKDAALELAVKSLDSAIKGLTEVSKTIDNNINEYFRYQAEINAKLQGTDLDYDGVLKTLTTNLGMSMLVNQKEYITEFKKLVDAGIAHNMETRAFLATVSDKVVNTFDAFDANLLRLVRLQQNDSTAARLGLESSLNRLFNSYFSDSSYLSDGGPHDSISAAILEASAMLTKDMSLEFEYIVHKWLGSLYSLGMSSDTLNKIAQGLNYLGTGNVSALNSNESLQTLLAMSAARGGESYAEILTEGLNAETTNNLLQGMITYLMEIASNTDTTQVTKSAYSDLFGLNMSDMRALLNLTSNDITSLAEQTTNYQQSLIETQEQLNSIVDRTHLSTKIDNLFENTVLGASLDIGNNATLYTMWKALNLIEGLTGGIALPFVNVFGSGLDLNTTVTELAKSGIAGFSLLGNILTSKGGTGGMSLEDWGNNELTVRGDANKFLASGTSSGFSSSARIDRVGSGNMNDLKSTEMSDATDTAHEDAKITNKYSQEDQSIPEQILETTKLIHSALAKDENTLLDQSIETYKLLQERLGSLSVLSSISTLLAPSRIFLSSSMDELGISPSKLVSNSSFTGGDVSVADYKDQISLMTRVSSVFENVIQRSGDLVGANVDIWSLIDASSSLTAQSLSQELQSQYTDNSSGFHNFNNYNKNSDVNTQLINALTQELNTSTTLTSEELQQFAQLQQLNKIVFPEYVRATIDELSPPVKKYVEELLRKAIETSIHGTDVEIDDNSTEYLHPIVRQLKSVLTDPTTIIRVEDSGY